MTDPKSTGNSNPGFQQKVWQAAGIVAFVVVLIWLLKSIFNVLLLILAGALIALFFHALGSLIEKKTGWSSGFSLVTAVISTVLLSGLLLWFTGDTIQQQLGELSKTLPQTIDRFKQEMNKSTIGRMVVERISNAGSSSKGTEAVKNFFSSTFGVLTDMYVVLFMGIFFTASPKIYIRGFMTIIPVPFKPDAERIIHKTGGTLTKWLKGKLLAMLVVAVLTAIGLLIMGVPMALTLALIAGVLNFIPNFGPVIAMIPAVLVGLMQSPTTALLVAALYVVIQVLESNLITPQIQKRLIHIPPALIIIAQLIMGVLTGGWGLLLATPIVMIVIVILQETYLKRQQAAKSA